MATDAPRPVRVQVNRTLPVGDLDPGLGAGKQHAVGGQLCRGEHLVHGGDVEDARRCSPAVHTYRLERSNPCRPSAVITAQTVLPSPAAFPSRNFSTPTAALAGPRLWPPCRFWSLPGTPSPHGSGRQGCWNAQIAAGTAAATRGRQQRTGSGVEQTSSTSPKGKVRAPNERQVLSSVAGTGRRLLSHFAASCYPAL